MNLEFCSGFELSGDHTYVSEEHNVVGSLTSFVWRWWNLVSTEMAMDKQPPRLLWKSEAAMDCDRQMRGLSMM